ncbi:MAG: hypothetical protein NTY19_51660 [Planctomycetota bacterium]|nr:hypothetical protein [Planctomycetota bacterium]
MVRRRSAAVVLLLLGAIQGFAAQAPADPHEAAARESVVRDWMLQDYMSIPLPEALERQKQQWRDEHLPAPESKPDAPVLEHLACFLSEVDAVVEQRMIDRVLQELGAAGQPLRATLDRLVQAGTPGGDGPWRVLYLRACELRRTQRLAPLVARWRQFVFNQHRHIKDSYKYTEALSNARAYRFFAPGASLQVLELQGNYGQVRTLLADPGGTLRNPDVSYDGRRILFAWKKSDRQDDYHLYEMEVATGDIRQLTAGPGIADYEGVYLPDGQILFNLTRCFQSVDCNWVEVSNFYLIDGDGRRTRRVGFDQVHTVFPTVTDDGRVLYTRWEYSDRGQIFPQPLFQMNTDGTDQREFYGNNSWFPTNIMQARKIPGTCQVLAILTGHHTPAHGKLAVIDPAVGRQEGQGVQLIAPVRQTEPIQVDRYGLGGNQFQYPYPVDTDRFLVTLALPAPDGTLGRFNIYCMDQDGRRELLVEGQEAGEGIGCQQIVPLAARREYHERASSVDYRQDTGTFFLQDVYEGLGLRGVVRGTIKKLRVVGLQYRASAIGSAHQEGRGGSSEVTTPIAIANGAWDVKVVLGTAQVHADGSAFFRVPARTPVYFQALDEQGYAVQTMRSWTTLMPGENQACVGCHEHKNSVPRAQRGAALALRAGPRTLEPFYGPPRGFSFAREIQPILDRQCASCHTGQQAKPPNLSGELVTLDKMKRKFSRSYLALTHTQGTNGDWNHPLVNWIDCMSEPSLLRPYHRGAGTSQLLALLANGHEGVQLAEEERDKLACWIDLLVPYCGDYLEANTWSLAEQEAYAKTFAKRKQIEDQEQADRD